MQAAPNWQKLALCGAFGRTQKEDVAAMEVVKRLMPGELHDMS